MKARIRTVAGAAAIVAARLVGSGPAPPQDSVTMDLPTARAFARGALLRGQPARARATALGLLRVEPRGPVALRVLSAAETALGAPGDGAEAAGRAFRLSQAPAARYEAAMLAALAHATAENDLRARIWLRRALQATDDPAAKAVAARSHMQLQRRARLVFDWHLSAAPSSNVNNGSRHEQDTTLGWAGRLSPDAQALSGWAAQFGVNARWRIAESTAQRTELTGAVFLRDVRLSRRSKDLLEAWRLEQLALGNVVTPQTDFDYAAVEAGIMQTRRAGRGMVFAGAAAGHRWYAGRDLSDYLRLDLGGEVPQDARTSLNARLTLERQWRRDRPAAGSDTVSAQVGVVRALGNGDMLRLSIGARDVASDALDVAHDAGRLRLAWERGAPVAGVRLAAAVGAERRRYRPSLFAPAGRRDLTLDAELSLTFERIDYMGFAPTVDIRATRFRSNVTRFDGRDLGLTVGFRSQF
ncbi:MAG: hypothetical protein ACK4KW_12375 [Gemmobacter sp.]